MRKKSLRQALPIPKGLRGLFDDPPLLASENSESYHGLLGAIVDELQPDSAIEWLRVQDIALQTWEIQRLWTFKRCIIELKREEEADSTANWAFKLQRYEEDPKSIDLSDFSVPEIDPETRRQLTPKLETATDSAKAFCESLDVHEILLRQIASLERRRDNTLREFEMHREIRARRARTESASLIEDKASHPPVAAE